MCQVQELTLGDLSETGQTVDHPSFCPLHRQPIRPFVTRSRNHHCSTFRKSTSSAYAKTKSRTAFWVIQKLSPPCCSVRSVPRRVARSIFRLIQFVTLCESTPNAVAKEQAE